MPSFTLFLSILCRPSLGTGYRAGWRWLTPCSSALSSENRETSGSTARTWALDGRRGGSDEGALACSSWPHWQLDFMFEMCGTVRVNGRAGGWPGSHRT